MTRKLVRQQVGAEKSARLAFVLAVYAAFAGLAVLFSALLGRSPLETQAWLGTAGVTACVLSAGLGTILGAATAFGTLVLVRRAAWVRALHADLRPVVRGANDATLVAMALASGVAEELLFRGLLVPVIGAIASSLAFGVLHQVRGRARWGWIGWAAVMGLLFSGLFLLTGSLVGPIVAHVLINAHNLRLLRDVDLDGSRRRPLGGLLAR